MRAGVGPVLARELLTRLRSTRAFLTLLVFNACVGGFVILGWSMAQDKALAASVIGEQVFEIVFFTQIALITLLAPAVSSGAITLERELGTLDLLRCVPISARRLLTEKFLAAITFFVVLLITSMPLVALARLLGGVTAIDIVSMIFTLMLLVGAAGAIGVGASTAFLRTQSALAVTYILILPLSGLLALVLRVGGVVATTYWSIAIGIIGIFVGSLLLTMAQKLLEEKEAQEVEPESLEDVSVHAGLLLDRKAFPDRLVWPPRRNALIPDGTNPIVEKDLRMETPGWSGKMISILIQGGIYLSLPMMLVPPFFWDSIEDVNLPGLIYALFLLGFLLLIAPAFSATAFSSERERKTLDLLASTPMPAWQVVGAKAFAALRGSLGMTLLLLMPYGLFAFFTFGGTFGKVDLGTQIVQMPIFALVLVTTAISVTFIGLWVSLRSRTTLRAMLLTYAIVAGIAIVPFLGFKILEPFTEIDYASFRWVAVPSPISAMLSAGGILGGSGNAFPLDPPGTTPLWWLYLCFWWLASIFLGQRAYAGYKAFPGD